MAEQVRIISVELNNYRQFCGKQKIDFSSREEGFTTLIGENGEGKSNILNAINWCFYKVEPHGKKTEYISAPVINSKYLLEQGKDKIARTSVHVILQRGDVQYSITRVLTVLVGDLEYEILENGEPLMIMARFADDKVPSGCEILSNETGFEIKKRGPNEPDFTRISGDKLHEMNTILPARLSQFFLLDGEFLEKFWFDFEFVEEGIEEISQLHLLSSAIDHVGEMGLRRITPGTGSEEETCLKIIGRNQFYEKSLDEDGNVSFSELPRWTAEGEEESMEKYHATGQPRIKDLEHDIKKMRRRNQDISRNIIGVNAASAKLLQKQFEDTEVDLKKASVRRKDLEGKWRDNLIDKSPYVFAKNALIDSIKLIETSMEKGELPNEMKKNFCMGLLDRGTCICEIDLKSKKDTNGEETNAQRNAVEQAKNTLQKDVGLDRAVKMNFAFKDKILDDYNGFLEGTFGNVYGDFRQAKKDEDDLNRKLKGIKDKLGSAGEKKIQKFINEQDQLDSLMEVTSEKVNDIKIQLSKNADATDTAKQRLIKLVAKNAKAAKQNHEMLIWDKARAQLGKIYDALKNEIRIDMQNKTWEIFTKILYKPEDEKEDIFKSFTIKPDYSVVLLNKQNQNHIVDISAGQSLFLALAFVTALREVTGYKFPLVIDTPMGKISGSNKYNLAQILPTYLKDEQLTFLATDTEWVADIPNISGKKREKGSFGELVIKKIPVKHYRIRKDRDGCSSINLAEYKNGEIKDG